MLGKGVERDRLITRVREGGRASESEERARGCRERQRARDRKNEIEEQKARLH